MCYKKDNILMCARACVLACACVYVWPADLFQVTNLALRSKRLPNPGVGPSDAMENTGKK